MAAAQYFTNERTFAHIVHNKLLGGLENALFAYLSENNVPDCRVLEIGSGAGTTLHDLHGRFNQITFRGIDKDPAVPKGKGDKLKFIHQDVQQLTIKKGAEFKFDIIFSVATFPYVQDKKIALQHIARALKPKGSAFIGVEAFYFGPEGDKIFEGCSHFRWNQDCTAILIKGGAPEEEIQKIMSGFFPYEAPNELLADLYTKQIEGKKALTRVPRALSNQEKQPLIEGLQKEEGLPVIFWEAFYFLKVHTYNPIGPDKSNQPFRYASSRFYLHGVGLQKEDLVKTFMNPQAWSAPLLDSSKSPKDSNYFDLCVLLQEHHLLQGLKIPSAQQLERAPSGQALVNRMWQEGGLQEEKNAAQRAAPRAPQNQSQQDPFFASSSPAAAEHTPSPKKSVCESLPCVML